MGSIESILRHYQAAQSAEDFTLRFLRLAKDDYDLEADSIVYADSVCSDDLLSEFYPPSAGKMIGPFKLGGLNGFPFAGVTGISAFAHHVPDSGSVLIFYGPHIGITSSGILGYVRRPNQAAPSTCCGAAQLGLAELERGQIEPVNPSVLDYQMDTIRQIFLASRLRILGSKSKIKEATEVMFEAIHEGVELLLSRTRFPCRFVFLANGILIHTDEATDTFVCLRRFEVIDNGSVVPRSLLDRFRAVQS